MGIKSPIRKKPLVSFEVIEDFLRMGVIHGIKRREK